MNYTSKLKNPRWQKKRLEVLNNAKFRCQICGNKDQELHVHHSYYLKGKEPWQHPACSMIAVCEDHHRMIHKKDKPPDPTEPQKEEVVDSASVVEQLRNFRERMQRKCQNE